MFEGSSYAFRSVEMAEPRPGANAQPEWTPSREEHDQLWKDSRLSIPPLLRIPAAAATAFGLGMTLGLSYGSKMAGLRFRAEHAHRLPVSTTGWYLYHKSKNYHLVLGGLKEGIRVGSKLAILSTAMFCAENLFDVYRGTKDMFNTTAAALAVAGGFSLLSTIPCSSIAFLLLWLCLWLCMCLCYAQAYDRPFPCVSTSLYSLNICPRTIFVLPLFSSIVF